MRIPPASPVGLAQIRVHRDGSAGGNAGWSTQYMSYFVLLDLSGP